ncbi:class I SAM-dependent methyltransferase [Microvirga arabica]|uniref:class I SAM-dependent methyltransferase n=1 Tax=Microvirga arabica TaxID=1128671 RepID=UPI0019396A66|nr:class I SAM-dependent methyltransferase [Microvirga arabica]MBM1173046.1 class I SAM-dependent methyltransferase [Microvirga arabica]
MLTYKRENSMKCDICSAMVSPDVLPETYRCPSCGFFKSTLPVQINEIERIDETAREHALKPIRTANFRQILDECGSLFPSDAEILDVGCAHGWFLEAAKGRGYKAIGIEPDKEMAGRALAAGHEVVTGFFPDALPAGRQFNVITFNDVFEHLPDVPAMAQAVHSRLKANGFAIINLPVSDGAVFRATRAAAKIGVKGPYERMWQTGLPSPHLSYFSAATLPRLMERTGFQLVQQGELEAIATNGLYERIRYDRNIGALQASALYVAAQGMRLLGHLTHSDIGYFAFKKIG